jgi:hypothetical protein
MAIFDLCKVTFFLVRNLPEIIFQYWKLFLGVQTGYPLQSTLKKRGISSTIPNACENDLEDRSFNCNNHYNIILHAV